MDAGSARNERNGLAAAAGTFDLLADETRWAIVCELAKHRRYAYQPRGLSFAELRRAVDVADGGRFNYHLNKLLGAFVNKTDGKYILTNQGFELVGSVLAGDYESTNTTRRELIDERCNRCENTLKAIYEHGYFRIECPKDGTIAAVIVPERLARERSIRELTHIAGRHMREMIGRAVDGVCPHCQGVAETNVTEQAQHAPGADIGDIPTDLKFVELTCTECEFYNAYPAYVYLVNHPAVVSFRYEHDDEPTGVPYIGTTLQSITAVHCSDETGDVENEITAEKSLEPVVRVEFSFDTDQLLIWLDEDASVVSIEERSTTDTGQHTEPESSPG